MIPNLKVKVNLFPFMPRLGFVLFPVIYVCDVITVVYFLISFKMMSVLPGLPSEHESGVPAGEVAVSRFF